MRGRAVQAVRAHGIAVRGGMEMVEGQAFGARLKRGARVMVSDALAYCP